MSIFGQILKWVNDDPPELFEIQPRRPGTLPLRRLFVSNAIRGLPWHEVRFEQFRSDLDRYASGEMIPVRLPPSKNVHADFALLDPPTNEPHIDRIWEIRSKDHPQLRAFGCFAQRDVFVALTCHHRSELATDDDWALAIRECRHEWQRLFGSEDPIGGLDIHAYLSRSFYVLK